MSKNKILPLNKNNLLALAEKIYSDKGGKVTYMKLCKGDLSNGKDGGRTLHCGIGEMYYTFVNHNVVESTSLAVQDLAEKASISFSLETLIPLMNSIAFIANLNDGSDRFIRRAKLVSGQMKKIAELLK